MKLIASFRYAFAGLAHLLKTQPNARIEVGAGLVVCAMAWWLAVSRVEWAVLILAIAAVLILETVNTSIEYAVDLACPEQHPKAKLAKDLAAAAVLIAAMASVVVGVLVLLPRLLLKLGL